MFPKKKSIKSIMKRRFGKGNTTESVTQNSENLECNTTPIKETSNFSGLNDLDFGPYLGDDGSLPGGSTFVQSTAQIVQSVPSAPILSQFNDLNISPIIDSKYIQPPNKEFISKKDADITIEHVITPITSWSKVTEWSNEVDDFNASEYSLSIQTIDDSLSSINTNKSNTQMLTGRRIVNMSHIIEQIKKRHSGPYGCSFIDIEYESEVNYGFLSEYIHHSEININNAAVNACQAIVFLDLPALSSTGFLRVQTEVAEIVHATAWDEMKKAGEEERRLAIESGSLGVNGTSIITVVTDGQWFKRSYKTKYDVLSGAKSSSMKDKEKPVHTCFLNWKKASTCMEADGVLQGFSNSVEMHGLKYNCLIVDGDSSVTKRLAESRPYGFNFTIRKIECKNHLMRNYASKLTTLARNSNYPLRVRKFILSNIKRFRSDVQMAALHWRKETNTTKSQKIKGLKSDLINAPYHRLGRHSNCSSYFCDPLKQIQLNLVPEAETSEMMREIVNISSRLVTNAESLLENKTSNICEQFNSIINKYAARKRLNFSSRGNYNTRVEVAVVSFNSKQYLRQIHKTSTKCSPRIFGKKFLKNSERIRLNTSKRRQLFPEKRKYGREMETKARQKFEQLSKEKVYENGLIIDPEFPFLAASPDGLIGEHYLLEIKCPYSARDSNDAIEAVNSKLVSVKLCLIIIYMCICQQNIAGKIS
ncbi:hypothetical protein QTP88_018094 [Uroleucon formosanum]